MPKTLSEKMMYALDTMVFNPYIKILFLGGSAGPGKSTALCTWLIEEAWRDPGSRAFIARETLVDLKKSTLGTLIGLIDEDYPWMKFKFDGQLNVLEFENGSTIYLVELAFRPRDPDYNRFGGYEFTRGVIDEVGETNEKAMWKIFARIRYKLPPIYVLEDDGSVTEHPGIPRMMMASNPTSNWLKFLLIEDKQGRPVTLPEFMEVVLMLLDDHPDKDYVKTYKETLKNLPPYDVQRLLYGSWNYVENLDPFFTEFDPYVHVGHNEINEDYAIWISFDLNTKPTTAIIGQKTDEGLEVIAEHQVNGTYRLCQELLRLGYMNYNTQVYVTGDRSGSSEQSAAAYDYNTDYKVILKELGISKSQLIDTISANKRHEFSRRLGDMVFMHCPIRINPKCVVLINELKIAKVDINQKLIKDRKLYCLDAFDAFRYLINSWFYRKGIEDMNEYVKFVKENQAA